jgi:hypothetical protein
LGTNHTKTNAPKPKNIKPQLTCGTSALGGQHKIGLARKSNSRQKICHNQAQIEGSTHKVLGSAMLENLYGSTYNQLFL